MKENNELLSIFLHPSPQIPAWLTASSPIPLWRLPHSGKSEPRSDLLLHTVSCDKRIVKNRGLPDILDCLRNPNPTQLFELIDQLRIGLLRHLRLDRTDNRSCKLVRAGRAGNDNRRRVLRLLPILAADLRRDCRMGLDDVPAFPPDLRNLLRSLLLAGVVAIEIRQLRVHSVRDLVDSLGGKRAHQLRCLFTVVP